MTPSTITHRGITIEVSDELTFKLASLLWEDIGKVWAVNGIIPNDAPKPSHTVTTSYVPTPETQVYVNTHPSPPLKLTAEPEKPPINRTLGGKGYQFVRSAPTIEECFIKFPNVPRANIERIWYNAHAPVKEQPLPKSIEIVPGTNPEGKITIEPRKGHSRLHNMDAGRWTEEEMELLRIITPVDKAIIHYRDKFPDSKRNDNAVRQKFNKLHSSLPTPTPLPTKSKPLPAKLTTPKPDKANKTQLGGIVLPDELKPLEEKKSFFIGAQVRQVAGHPPLAFGTGDIIDIKSNGDIVVEFYKEKKTLKRDELAFYQHPNKAGGQA